LGGASLDSTGSVDPGAGRIREVEVQRSRVLCLCLLAATVAFGLASRRFPDAFQVLLARYGGDAAWAGMVFWLIALLRPAVSTGRIALAALSISLAVEVSQLYRAPWIDAVRATRPGALVLGQGFLWSDLACYAAGVALAAVLDRWISAFGAAPEQD
jgi:hypothetical protein